MNGKDKNLDGIKKLSGQELERSRKIVLDYIGEKDRRIKDESKPDPRPKIKRQRGLDSLSLRASKKVIDINKKIKESKPPVRTPEINNQGKEEIGKIDIVSPLAEKSKTLVDLARVNKEKGNEQLFEKEQEKLKLGIEEAKIKDMQEKRRQEEEKKQRLIKEEEEKKQQMEKEKRKALAAKKRVDKKKKEIKVQKEKKKEKEGQRKTKTEVKLQKKLFQEKFREERKKLKQAQKEARRQRREEYIQKIKNIIIQKREDSKKFFVRIFNPPKLKAATKFVINIIFFLIVLLVLCYFIFTLLLFKFNLNNKISQQITEYVPVPVIVTKIGYIEYYDYLNILTNFAGDKEKAKTEAVKRIVFRHLLETYNFNEAVNLYYYADNIIKELKVWVLIE